MFLTMEATKKELSLWISVIDELSLSRFILKG